MARAQRKIKVCIQQTASSCARDTRRAQRYKGRPSIATGSTSLQIIALCFSIQTSLHNSHLSNMASAPKSAKPAGPKEKTLKIAKKATSTKATAKLAASHPSWKDMIKVTSFLSLPTYLTDKYYASQECIVDHPEDARSGVSRATIKKVHGVQSRNGD